MFVEQHRLHRVCWKSWQESALEHDVGSSIWRYVMWVETTIIQAENLSPLLSQCGILEASPAWGFTILRICWIWEFWNTGEVLLSEYKWEYLKFEENIICIQFPDSHNKGSHQFLFCFLPSPKWVVGRVRGHVRIQTFQCLHQTFLFTKDNFDWNWQKLTETNRNKQKLREMKRNRHKPTETDSIVKFSKA